jgi:hypothetical protein
VSQCIPAACAFLTSTHAGLCTTVDKALHSTPTASVILVYRFAHHPLLTRAFLPC